MRASDEAYRQLRGDILSWRLTPGTALGEIELAARLGISRTPLRAALSRLALEGFVDTTRGRTAIVSHVSAESVSALYELRMPLEREAARLAAERGDRAVFASLAERFDAADAMLDAGDIDGYYALVAEVDAAIDAAIANPAFVAALDNVRLQLMRARRLASESDERLRRTASEHALICDAIARGDAELASAAVAAHLGHALESILTALSDDASSGRERPHHASSGRERPPRRAAGGPS